MSLREQVMRGGVYMAARQTIGTAINVVGMLTLTRVIGPGAYGLYAAALGFFVSLQLLAQLGTHVYLLRLPRDIERVRFDHASMFLLLAGSGVAVAGLLAIPLIESATRLEGVSPLLAGVFLALPMTNLGVVALAKLDRDFSYKRIATIELIGQASVYALALPLAFRGAGAYAPLAGWWLQQIVLFVGYIKLSHYTPRPRWDRDAMGAMLRYGSSYTMSMWLYQLRRTVNPLVVGRFAGAEAVGIVSLTVQIVTQLGFVSVSTWRIATSALSRVQDDTAKLLRAVGEGSRLQVLAMGPFVVAFGLVAPYVVPRILGEEWSGAAVVYPYIALGMLTNSMFSMHSAALYVLGHNWRVAVFHSVHTASLSIAALMLVPQYGLLGYGLAEIAALFSYIFIARAMATVGPVQYGFTPLILVAFALGLFIRQIIAMFQ